MIEGQVLRPGGPEYEQARQVFNAMIDRHPTLIARCAGAGDVAAVVQFAGQSGLPLSIRSGGHNVAGHAVADGGVMIDLSDLRSVRVDPASRTATADPGATWFDFDHATHAHGLATTGGLVSSTGIAGFTLGGGIGWLVRKHGLACDNLIGAEVVTADGHVIEADNDLLWGLRGGGGNFGVVTSFRYRLHPLREVVGGMVAHPRERATQVIRFFRDLCRDAPDELTAIAALMTTPEGRPAVALAACYAGPTEDGKRALRPLREFGPPVLDHIGVMPYPVLQSALDPTAPWGSRNYWKSDFLPELSDGAIDLLVEQASRMRSPLAQVHLHHLGGAMSKSAAGATAFPSREADFVYNLIGLWMAPEDDEANIAWARGAFEAMRPVSAGGAYVNFMGEEAADRVRAAYGPNYERLVALKRRYDPHNRFRMNQNISPTG
ncbi:MAG: FAD-binding oxidoreductase [Acidimicrobiaceae bacterium]|nr:FAD-binding oxidoreductase [Acidimicrobiaceae bacterium]